MLSDLTELGRLHLSGDSPAGPRGAMCHLHPPPPTHPPRWQFLVRRLLSAESLRGELSM